MSIASDKRGLIVAISGARRAAPGDSPLPPPGLESADELEPLEPTCVDPEIEVDWAQQDENEDELEDEESQALADPQSPRRCCCRIGEPSHRGGRLSMKRRA